MWMVVAGVGGLLGLSALAGMIWAFRKVEGGKKWGALGGFSVMGLAGLYLAINCTAIAPPEEAQRINEQVEAESDLDAPLDDDF
ncbi:MAG: hypothetical protein AAF411_16070 [Myxococcota bacterium]